MFKEVLKEVVDGTQGGIAGLLMGLDGIPVDQYIRDQDAVDVATVGSEYSVVLKSIKTAAQMLEVGSANEVAIQAERMTTVIRLLNEEYFVAVTLAPGGNVGKARFLLRTRGEKILAELS